MADAPVYNRGVLMKAARISRRTALRASAGVVLASTLAWAVPLVGCSSPGSSQAGATSTAGLKWVGAGRTRRLSGFARLLVQDFKERVSGRSGSSSLDRRAAQQAMIREAVRTVPDRIAEAVRRTNAFAPVLRGGVPDQLTIVMDGTLIRYDEGSSDTRRATGARFGAPQCEVHLEFRDGGSGEVLATLVAENAPAGGSQNPQAPESLEGAVARVAESIAQTLVGAARYQRS